ncbi:MAG TPA: amino acid adenylation domain-containing protein, partial [Longimicrobiaceae bacterium]|nr:amino acid adenylation domain-containing protein [Longimicrobiaceae bacterium]
AGAELEAGGRAEVAFNYLGQFDQTVSQGGFFAFAPESPGASAEGSGTRSHRLEVSGAVQGGRLELEVGYSEGVYRRETVERVAGWYREELRELIAHCTTAGAGGYTPSDFPLAALGQEALDRLLGSERGVEDVYPLTPMQQGMLFHALYAPNSGIYVGHLALVLEGTLDAGALERAWQGGVGRHAALRASFAWEGLEQPVQVIRRAVEVPFRWEDWRGRSAAEQEAALGRYLEEDRRAGFELGRAPLMRVALFRTGEREHWLVWTHHHLILDGWSLPVLFRDVLALYEAYRRGEAPQVGEGRPYGEYVAWLGRQDLGRAEAYWREALAGFTAPTPLPLRPAVAKDSGSQGHGEAWLSLGTRATTALQGQGRRWGVTMNTLVQGAWALLLARYSDEDDVVFGTTVSGRPAELAGVEEMVGLFINTLPVRVRVEEGASLRDWLRELQGGQVMAREYEFSPLVQVQKWSEVPAGEPLFESLVVFENYPIEEGLGEGLDRLQVRRKGSSEETNYPLVLSAVADARLVAELHYDRGRIEPEIAERMMGHLETVLAALGGDPRQRLSDVSLLTDAERAQVLEAWRGPAAAYPRTRCIHELIGECAAAEPGAVAVVCGEVRLTYAELNARAGRLADRLRSLGVGCEDRVGVCLERSAALAIAILGVLRAGGAYVPLDPAYPGERLSFLLADSEARVVVTRSGLGDLLPPDGPARLLVDSASDADVPVCEPDGVPDVDPADLAYVIYTSGSTGTPKGVMVSHRSLVCYAEGMRERLGLRSTDRFLQFASPGFDVMVEEIFPAWLSGAAVVFPEGDLLDSPSGLLEVVEAQGVTAFELPTAFWHTWVHELSAEGRRLPESVRFVIVGGERVLPERLAEWARQELPLVHVFGLTETTVTTTTFRLEAGDDGSRWSNLPVGHTLPNAELYILDTRMHPVPAGAVGELYVGGEGVARGYAGRPALTAERFVPDPFAGAPGARLYRTGDRVRWSEAGGLEFLGRVDQQVKVRGYRIEPGEIEAALVRHPAVSQAAVAVREGSPGQKQLVAYVVPAAGYRAGLGGLHRSRLELWPSHGEAGYYDDLIYKAMAEDHRRNRGYLDALRSVASGKVVVDVGTGAEVVLSRLALEAGARRVYAIETKEESYRQAEAFIRRLGLEDRIVLVKGNGMEVEIPEPADVCVSELIGCIGGSEGAVAILNTVWRLLKPDGVQVPRRCVTRIAAVELPDEVHEEPALEEIAAYYAEKIFEAQGHRQDVKMCVRNFPRDHILSDPDVFEDLLFTAPLDPEYSRTVELTLTRDGRLDGFLMWIQLYMWEELDVDSLEHECCWLPMFFPAFYPGVEVRAGDVLRAECSVLLADNGVHPEYRIEGELHRVDGRVEPFEYDSFWRKPPEEPNPFHCKIFLGEKIRIRGPEEGKVSLHVSTHELREHLLGRLPEYMVPGTFVALERLPLTANGKVDCRALPDPVEGRIGGEESHVAPSTAVEETLCRIWAEVLRVERVGVHDNFFELGGDSILSIQIVSRARAAGFRLRPRQLFLHPTVARLALEVGALEGATVQAEQAPVTGDVELTPIQRWFFESPIPERHHWNMSLLLELRRPVDPAVLEAAVQHLVMHHDALRLRYSGAADGEWRQSCAPVEEPVVVERVDLSWVPAWELTEEIERRCAAVQAGLHLDRGPLLRVALLEPGNGRPSRLLLVVHHLVVDGVSWRILLEDLQKAYDQLGSGTPVSLPPKTTSFQFWAHRLAEHTAAGGFDGELEYWVDESRRTLRPLPVDMADGAHTAGSTRALSTWLDAEDTQALLQEVPSAYRTQVNDALLTALARTFAGWTGDARVLVEMEGHGREDLFDDVDLTRTVGWFTTTYPVLLDLRGAGDEGAALKRVKEQLRGVPNQGIGFGALRYLRPDAAGRERMSALPRAEVGFNHLGQADQALADEGMFSLARESAGDGMSPLAPRNHLFEVSTIVIGGRLRVDWSYSEAVHRPETVESLAERYLAELRGLVAHCHSVGAGGYTPSDFPLAGVDQETLDELLGSERGIEDLYPLSPVQEGILFHLLYAPDSGVYLAQSPFVLEGEVDPRALRLACQGAVARHSALRAGFAWGSARRPLQVVRRQVELPFREEDWRGLDEMEREARREAYLREDRAQGFDPARPPLMRVALFRIGEDRYHMVWSFLQVVLDGWSLPLLFRDVLALYEAHSRGETPQLGEGPRYRDYVAWLERQDLACAERYWREALRGITAPTPLPFVQPDVAGEQAAGIGVASLRFTGEPLRVFQEQARRWGVTMNTLVQGAWALLLSRYADEDDVVFGATVSGRPAELPGVEEMVGLFINTLPVRVRVEEEAKLESWLGALQEEQVRAREYEYSPLVEVQKWSEVPAGEALFESLVVFENYPVEEGSREGVRKRLRVWGTGSREQPHYPLVLVAVPGADLELQLRYARGRVEAGAAERIAGHLETVLAGMVADPGQTVATVPLLGEAERVQVLEGWNATRRPYPVGVCVHDLFHTQVARTPDAVAVSWRGERTSYAELDRRASRLAHALRRRGVGPETPVGVCLGRTPELIAALLGVLKAGGAYVPLDPAYPRNRLGFILEDAGVALVLTESRLADRLPEGAVELLVVDREEQQIAREPEVAPESGVLPENLSHVIFTSGSTGRPKGVMIRHSSTVVLLHWLRENVSDEDRSSVLFSTSISFDVSVAEVFGTLCWGGKLVLVENALELPELQEEVFYASMVPSVAAELLRSGGIPASVRTLNLGGEALPNPLEQGLYALDTVERVGNLYGPTEDTTYSTYSLVERGGSQVYIGRPVANTRAYLLDSQLRPVPVGAIGELYLSGDGLSRGYASRPDLTAERFLPDPFGVPGSRMYRVMDRVRYRPDGVLEYFGRIDFQVKVRGFRIEPGEVEATLLGCPDVREAVVVAREDAPGQKHLVAYLVLEPEAEVSTTDLRTVVRERLPEYMVPAAVVVLEAMPLTVNGKIDRRALPAPEWSGEARYTAPTTPLEQLLCETWAE